MGAGISSPMAGAQPSRIRRLALLKDWPTFDPDEEALASWRNG